MSESNFFNVFEVLAKLSSDANEIIEKKCLLDDVRIQYVDQQYNKISLAVATGGDLLAVITGELGFQVGPKEERGKSVTSYEEERRSERRVHLRDKNTCASHKNRNLLNAKSKSSSRKISEKSETCDTESTQSSAQSTLRNSASSSEDRIESTGDVFINKIEKSEKSERRVHLRDKNASLKNRNFLNANSGSPSRQISEKSETCESESTQSSTQSTLRNSASSSEDRIESTSNVLINKIEKNVGTNINHSKTYLNDPQTKLDYMNLRSQNRPLTYLSSESSDDKSQNASRRQTFVIKKPTAVAHRPVIFSDDTDYDGGSSSHTTATSTCCTTRENSTNCLEETNKPKRKCDTRGRKRKKVLKSEESVSISELANTRKRGRPKKAKRNNNCTNDKTNISTNIIHSTRSREPVVNVMCKSRDTEALLKAAASRLSKALLFSNRVKKGIAVQESATRVHSPVSPIKQDSNRAKMSLQLKVQEKKRIREERMRKTREAREKLEQERELRVRVSEKRWVDRVTQFEEQSKKRRSEARNRTLRPRIAKKANKKDAAGGVKTVDESKNCERFKKLCENDPKLRMVAKVILKDVMTENPGILPLVTKDTRGLGKEKQKTKPVIDVKLASRTVTKKKLKRVDKVNVRFKGKAQESKENKIPKKNESSKLVNGSVKQKSITSASSAKASPYFDPESSSYKMSDYRSDSDIEEDIEAPKKSIPLWATGLYLKEAVMKQHYDPPDLTSLFGEIQVLLPIDLPKIFNMNKERYHHRTSSANWRDC